MESKNTQRHLNFQDNSIQIIHTKYQLSIRVGYITGTYSLGSFIYYNNIKTMIQFTE